MFKGYISFGIVKRYKRLLSSSAFQTRTSGGVSLALAWVILCISIINAKAQNNTNIELEIKQTVLPSMDGHNIFKIQTGKLIIMNRILANDGKEEFKKTYSKKIKNADLKKIEDLAGKLKGLNNEYMKNSLDGLTWEINIKEGEYNKKIIVKNYNVQEVDILFIAINKLIPKRKPKIPQFVLV